MLIKAIQQAITPDALADWRTLYQAYVDPDRIPDPILEGSRAPGEIRRGDTLTLKAIEDFILFTNEYSEYLENLIQEINLEEADTTESRLRDRFQQSFNDSWAPLGQVATQRLVPLYREHLNAATDVAHDYLKQIGLQLDGALVYFNKVTSIRYYPYSRIAFLGIPYAQTLQGIGDWMAIPHELGHYLYWNYSSLTDSNNEPEGSLSRVRDNQQTIKGDAQNAIQSLYARSKTARDDAIEHTILQWTEEIFCDVVGTYLAGQHFVESLGDLIRARAGNHGDLLLNDGEHPPHCLRPYIREIAQRLITNNEESVVNWQEFFSQYFKVDDPLSMELFIPDPEAKRVFEKMEKSQLLAIFASEQPFNETDIPYIKVPVSDFLPGLVVLVGRLLKRLQDIKENAQQFTSLQFSRFEELRVLAESEAQSHGRPTHEVIFAPRILEGGWQHSHPAYWHFTTHELGEHPH